MKIKLIAFIVTSLLTIEARAEISEEQVKQGQSLMTFYKAATGYTEALPLREEFSECAKGVCAFNFETDREDFGILARTIPFSAEDWSGFTVDPNGVSLGDDQGDLDLSIEAIEDGDVLEAKHVKAIGDTFEKAFAAIGGEVGPIIVDASICRSHWAYVSCFLNFDIDNGRESFGVLFHGLISSDKNSIDYIETLDTDANGVSW